MLPQGIHGWIIDYRAAWAIFDSENTSQIEHCTKQCKGGFLHICHLEEQRFKNNSLLANIFLNECNCVYEPNDKIYKRCKAIHEHPSCKPILIGNEAAALITATAAEKKFGVISKKTSSVFSTTHDLCAIFGVPSFTIEQFFSFH